MELITRSVWVLFLAVLLLVGSFGCDGEEEEEDVVGEIHVRGLFDITGPTAESTSDKINAGLLDYIEHVNQAGGISGYQVIVEQGDHAYNGDLAIELYEEFKAADDADGDGNWDTVVSLFGEGTPDTMATTASVTADELPYLSAAYPGSLTSPEGVQTTVDLPDGTQYDVDTSGAPYNFFVGCDYSTGIRIGMQFMADNGGGKVAFVGCSNGYCTGPLPAGKTYADDLGLEIAPDLEPCDSTDEDNACPELSDTEEVIADKMEAYFTANTDIDWVWIGNLTDTAVYIVKGALAVNPDLKFVSNVFGFDESVYERCGEDCVDRMYGMMPFAAYGDMTVSGMSSVVEIFDEAGHDDSWQIVRYVQGHVGAVVWTMAVEDVIEAGEEITGPNIRAALESFNNVSTGGLTAPISYSPTDHRPYGEARIYSVDSNGNLHFESEASIDLEDDWLGW